MAGQRTIKIKISADAKGVVAAVAIAERSLGKLKSGIDSAGRMAVPAAASAAAILGAAIAPALAASLAAGVTLAFGGGVLIAGILSAAKDPGVAKAFGGLKDKANAAFKDFGKPFIEPLKRAATTFGDALTRMAPVINDLGKAIAPIIDKLAPALTKMIENSLPGIKSAVEASIPVFTLLADKVLPKVGEWFSTIIQKVAELTVWFGNNSDKVGAWISVLAPIVGIFLGIIAAIRVWIAVQTLLNVVMSLNPIGLIIIAVAALIAIIIVIATKTKFFQTVWAAAWGGIKSAASAVGSWFKNTLWGSWIKGAWEAIVNKGKSVLAWFRSVPGAIRGFFSNLGDTIMAPFRSAFGAIARLWNNTVGRLSFSVPGWVPGIGGKSFSLPRLPERRWGGPVTAGKSYLVGEKGPEVFTAGAGGRISPNEALSGGDQTINLHADFGDGISQVFEFKISQHDRQTKRRVSARRMV